jgi:mannose-6-phosphate isomerase-like protein (cupin superfamily)
MTEDNWQDNPYYQIDSYMNWARSEGVPIVEAYAVDCLMQPLEPWHRIGGLGALVHLVGRGDMMNLYLAEIPAGGSLRMERHLYDKVVYVLTGRGATTVESPDGARHSFEWGPGSLFGIPINAQHQHHNGSGTEPARFAALTNLPIILNLFHNEGFVFENRHAFQERVGEERYYRGEGEFRSVKPGRDQWETNLVSDLTSFQLPEWKARGASARTVNFTLADSTLHAHISEFGVGTYKKAHRHNAGAHIFCVTGHGYSLLWKDDEDPVNTVRVDWKPGTLYAPPDGPTFHQHFNTANVPSRYLALGSPNWGGTRYYVSAAAKRGYEQMDQSVSEGGNQIEYEDEDPRVLALYEQECARHGVQSRMGR